MLVVLESRHGAEPGVGEVGHARHPLVGAQGRLSTAQSSPERFSELCREGVVQNGIYGAKVKQ